MELTPEDWKKVKALFDSVLSLEPSERASFLARNCPDDGLRQEVEKLVSNYCEAGQFLSDPALSPRNAAARPNLGVRAYDESADFEIGSGVLVATTPSPEEDVMAGRRLGVYKLVRRVGQGGMASVYLAVRADGEFRQQVAIKLVRAGSDSDEVLSRFRNERQTLAGLDHPNVVKLLDGGSTSEGTPYLVMDYVEGSPIDEYCERQGLSVEECLHLFGKVCEAVEYAHQKQVIHRDLKPSNILVTADGVPKLLDFGIAKVPSAQRSDEALRLTHTGARCMTPAYASPEQVRGKSPTFATDIYSLGVVLYELLTGTDPYRLKEHTPAEMERAICEQEPEAPSTAVNRVESETSADGTGVSKTPKLVSQTREGQPDKLRRRLRGDLDTILLKALQKEPERRYGSVAELAGDIDRHLQHLPVKARRSTLRYRASKFLRRYKIEVGAALIVLLALGGATSFAFNALGLRDRLARAPSHTRIQSLAVIPLLNLSGDPAQEYLSDGITETLTTDLAEIGSLKVISHTSVMQYKNTKKSLPEIARELNVDGIIQGTVQRFGDRLRVTAQLMRGPSNRQLWSKTYERDFRDVFELERDVTGDIAFQIQASLTTSERDRPAQPRQVEPRVLEAYLQGNYHLGRSEEGFGWDEELDKAAEYFQKAIDDDPNYAPAYNGLASTYQDRLNGSSEGAAIARRAAEKAVELDPNYSDAQATLGQIKWQPYLEWQGAEANFRRAISINPNNADAHMKFGEFLVAMGHRDEGVRECHLAQQLNPNQDSSSSCLYWAHDYDGSIAILRMMLWKNPNDEESHAILFGNYLVKGMHKEAMQELAEAFLLSGFPKVATSIRRALAVSGYQGALRQAAKETEHLQEAKKLYMPGFLAAVYAELGDKDRAFYWLEQAYEHREMTSKDEGIFYLGAEPSFEALRSDPRYKELLRRIGLPP